MRSNALPLVVRATLLAATLVVGATAAHADNIVTNPDFTASAYNSPGDFSDGTSAPGWSGTGTGLAGVSAFGGGGNWDNGYVPGQGSSGYVGFVATGGTLSTTVSGLTVGDQYTLSFYADARAYNGTYQGYPAPAGDDTTYFDVSFGDSTIMPSTSVSNIDAQASGTDPFTLFSTTVTATGTSEVLTFANVDASPNDTALFADASLSQVPEPATLGLFGSGLLALRLVRRRRATAPKRQA